MTKDEILQAISNLAGYRAHLNGCEIDMTDFCTCGMREAFLNSSKAFVELRDHYDRREPTKS